MEVRFVERDDGQIDAELDSGWSLLAAALNDSVSSLPPRGWKGNGPSTYWVDVALHGLQRAVAAGSDRPFTWGNITLLRLIGGRVEARYDFDEEDVEGQFLEVLAFQEILEGWRRRIAERAATSSAPLPETYRRNPSPEVPV